ncbi:hypothetical protein JZ751_001769, partial [Albula glossodonta]
WTPLHEAVLGGWNDVVEVLLQAGAVVNCTGDNGVTPLHDAIANGCRQAAQLLLNSGADPLLKNKEGKTALDMTADDTLINMMEAYLPRAKRKSLSAQSWSNHTNT